MRKDRSAAGGGVAILIKKEIAYSIVYTGDINAETVAITFKQRDKEIALATVYNPPGKIVELETLKHLTDNIALSQAISTQNMLILATTRVTALLTLFLTLLRSWTSQYSMMSL